MPAPTPSPPRALRERQARVSQLGLREKSEEGYETGFLSGSAPRVVCPGQLCLLTNFREVPSLTSLTAKRAKTLCIWLISLAPIHCLRKRVLMVASRQRHLCELRVPTVLRSPVCLSEMVCRALAVVHHLSTSPWRERHMCFMLACLFFFSQTTTFLFFFLHLGHFFYAAPSPHSPTQCQQRHS